MGSYTSWKNIWNSLPKPIFALAPMEDVTDTVFRQIIISCGRPAVFFTEFTNVDGMMSAGQEVVSQRLKYESVEKPLIAQIWGMNPDNFYKASQKLVEMGFDGIDINMGCPQHDVVRHGACSALIKNHSLAKEIIEATREGVWAATHPRGVKAFHLGGETVPVSVKTRIGFSTIQTEDWIGFLLEQNLPLITIHGRTAKEMSAVPAHWDEIGKAVKMRDEREKKNVQYQMPNVKCPTPNGKTDKSTDSGQARMTVAHTLVFGNGDVESLQEAKEKVVQYGVDGVMIGRGIFHNPWLFAGIDSPTKSLKDRLDLLKKHVELYQATWKEKKNYQVLKKYFKIYLSGFDGASELRVKFMETKTYEEAIRLALSVKRKV